MVLPCGDAHQGWGLHCFHRHQLMGSAELLSALTGLQEGAGLEYCCVITPVALSEGKQATSIYQLPHDVIVALEEKVLSVLTQMKCVCVFLKRRFVFAMQARKSEKRLK